MYIIVAAMTADPGSPTQTKDPEVISDIFWALASKEDGLEHLRVQMSHASRVDLVLFVHAPDRDRGARNAAQLCRRITQRVPSFAGWRVTYVHPVDPYP